MKAKAIKVPDVSDVRYAIISGKLYENELFDIKKYPQNINVYYMIRPKEEVMRIMALDGGLK